MAVVVGMLRLTGKADSPHYVFWLDGRNEWYMAKRTADGLYVFHGTNESKIVGRMRVSSLVTHNQGNTEIKETKFVLFGVEDDKPIHVLKKKHSLLPRKVMRVFKPNIMESNPRSDLFLPNLELVAIVVKQLIPNPQQEEARRGWGLHFLRKPKNKKEDTNNKRSANIDIVIAAGIHGGPRKMEEAPSGLLQRWRLPGQCNCGGWDIGCSLKVLKTRPTENGCSSPSFDLFLEGSNNSTAPPMIKITYNANNLYLVDFETGISALQTFATAVAIIHCGQLKQIGELKTQQD